MFETAQANVTRSLFSGIKVSLKSETVQATRYRAATMMVRAHALEEQGSASWPQLEKACRVKAHAPKFGKTCWHFLCHVCQGVSLQADVAIPIVSELGS